MIYVFEKGNIVYDGSTITEERKAKAVAVESLPVPNTPSGHYAQIRANLDTQEVYYEYIEDAEAVKLQKLLDDAIDLLLESEVL